jgi:hypothetical protein
LKSATEQAGSATMQGVAVVRASGGGGEFLTLLKVFDSLFLSYLLPTASHSSTGTSELVRLALLLGLPFADFAAELNKLQNENARYEVDYVLRPGARRVEIHSRIINKTRFPLQIPSSIWPIRPFSSRSVASI